jgi:hypothetical protein
MKQEWEGRSVSDPEGQIVGSLLYCRVGQVSQIQIRIIRDSPAVGNRPVLLYYVPGTLPSGSIVLEVRVTQVEQEIKATYSLSRHNRHQIEVSTAQRIHLETKVAANACACR